jgi:hypothetical protein
MLTRAITAASKGHLGTLLAYLSTLLMLEIAIQVAALSHSCALSAVGPL